MIEPEHSIRGDEAAREKAKGSGKVFSSHRNKGPEIRGKYL